jgi:hypothetical protein
MLAVRRRTIVMRRRIHAERMFIAIVVVAASAGAAESELPSVVFGQSSKLTHQCQTVLDDAAALLPRAMACAADTDCELYPCSCSAIGMNDEAGRYKTLVDRLQTDCAAGVVYSYCGPTVAICENGRCGVRVTEQDE